MATFMLFGQVSPVLHHAKYVPIVHNQLEDLVRQYARCLFAENPFSHICKPNELLKTGYKSTNLRGLSASKRAVPLYRSPISYTCNQLCCLGDVIFQYHNQFGRCHKPLAKHKRTQDWGNAKPIRACC